jgi:hypothetical protein
VDLKDYGQARQITLFGHGQVALQILISDTTGCPAQILSWLKSRWREEKLPQYASANLGTGVLCDYIAAIEINAKITYNSAREIRRRPHGQYRTRHSTTGAAGLLCDGQDHRRGQKRHSGCSGRPRGTSRRGHGVTRDPADRLARVAVLQRGRAKGCQAHRLDSNPAIGDMGVPNVGERDWRLSRVVA